MQTITQTITTSAPVERANVERANDGLLMVAATCPSCDGHNVSDRTGLGACGDCGLNDNLSAFMGGGMTSKARFQPSKFAQGGRSARSFSPRAFTGSGGID